MTKLMLLVQQQRLTQHGSGFVGPVSLLDGGHQQQLCAGRLGALSSLLLGAGQQLSSAAPWKDGISPSTAWAIPIQHELLPLPPAWLSNLSAHLFLCCPYTLGLSEEKASQA